MALVTPEGDWNVPESELPARRLTSTARADLVAAGYQLVGEGKCPACGSPVASLQSPYNSTHVLTNLADGTLHTGCRQEREPVIEPLPPVATFEEQQAKLDELLGRKA